jgi:hypothetical protein
MAIPSPTSPAGDQRYLVPTDRNQYSQTWSFTVQRALTSSLMWETAYVGTSGNRLLITSNINAAPPGLTAPTARQPFGPALGEVREITNSGHSIYHGLQTKLEQRFAHGVYFLGSYTWSKSIDNQSNGTDDSAAGGQYPQNPNNWSLDRGLSSFDRTHRFVASTVWEIPFRSGGHGDATGTAIVRGVLGGWQLSGIVTAETGTPFSVIMPCAAVNSEGNNCRPNLIGSGMLPADQRSVNEWFNTAAFVIPSTPVYGDAGRNILRAPGLVNLDAALSKSFSWGNVDTRRIQFRSEFFNALNHTNLGIPVNSTSSPGLGTITSAAPARTIQLGLRLEF